MGMDEPLYSMPIKESGMATRRFHENSPSSSLKGRVPHDGYTFIWASWSGGKARGVVTLCAARGVYRADTVELEVPVWAVGARLDEKLNARVFADGGLVGVVLGSEEVAPYEEVDVNMCAGMCAGKRG